MATQFLKHRPKKHSSAIRCVGNNESAFQLRTTERTLPIPYVPSSEWWLSVDYAEFIEPNTSAAFPHTN